MSQLTSPEICKQKHTYHTVETARRAAKRRNKAAGYKYLRQYRCDNCKFWHVTTQYKEDAADLSNEHNASQQARPNLTTRKGM